jgi:hypothetical protein
MQAEQLETTAPLPATARALRAGTLRVLVLGSASPRGPGTSGPAAAWPARLGAYLQARQPGLALSLEVRGGRGLNAAEQLAILLREQPALDPQLVIWQTGTVEAARGLDVDEMTESLNTGLDRLRVTGTDALLVEPQFSRFLRANADVEVYRRALWLVAAGHQLPIFRRWEVMRHWAETEALDLERAARTERAATADRLHDCLAKALASLILAAVARP